MEDLRKSFHDFVHSPRKHHTSRSRSSDGASPPDGSSCSSGSFDSSPETEKLLENFRIPSYIFCEEEGDNKADESKDFVRPSHPVVVFINSKSGGQLGGELLVTYKNLLGNSQVFDLGTEAPDKVLQKLFTRLETLSRNGDSLASEVKGSLRLIVAGGDGTAGWLLGVVCDLKLSRPPPIVTVPLGTGNNLPFAFGWGKKNPGTDRQSVIKFLESMEKAKTMEIDNWHIIMRMETPDVRCDPIPPLDLPHSLHKFQRISSLDSFNQEGHQTYRGGFWNYFSMGMDAQVSYEFHTERKKHPEKFRNQLLNQSTYVKLGLGTLFKSDSSRSISQLAKIKVMKAGGHWEDLNIDPCIKSIICVNLPSFSGGFNPWGTPHQKSELFKPMHVDDGLIEVVGFKDALHGLVLLSSKGHGIRLAQAQRIEFEFQKGATDCTYMRIDGEPWKQPLPSSRTVKVEICHHGRVSILATTDCKSKSIRDYDPSVLTDSSESPPPISEDNFEEERRKFGSAETFRLPDDMDLSHFS